MNVTETLQELKLPSIINTNCIVCLSQYRTQVWRHMKALGVGHCDCEEERGAHGERVEQDLYEAAVKL